MILVVRTALIPMNLRASRQGSETTIRDRHPAIGWARMEQRPPIPSGHAEQEPTLDAFARTVLGYHGCRPDFAEALIRGEVPVAAWAPSQNDWDWLGHGIYFWEYAPERARDWMGAGGVVGAIIQLGNCLDFTDVTATRLLQRQYQDEAAKYRQSGHALPVNRGLRGDLDCLMINQMVASLEQLGQPIETLRSPFLEGHPVYPGSRIRLESHVQLVVRTHRNILGVFRPNLVITGG